MKTINIYILVTVLLISTDSFSQQLSKMGENYLKQYKASIEKLKLMESGSPKIKNEFANAERLIKSIQKSDPNYNVTELNNALTPYKGNAESQLSNNGKTYLKEINKHFENLRTMDPSNKAYQDELVIAKRNVEYLTKSDPNYNFTEINSEIKEFEKSLMSGTNKNEVAMKNAQDLDSDLIQFLETSLSFTYSKQELKENISQLQEFETNFNDYLQNTLLKNSDSKYSLPKIEQWWQDPNIDKEELETYKNSIPSNTNEIYTENSYYQIMLIKTKWSLLSNAFPSSSILKSAVNNINSVIELEGGKDGILKIAKKNKLEETKKRRMSPSENNDPAIIEQIKTALMKSNHISGRTILKVNILRSDWIIETDKITGKILGRALDYEAALKNQDGSCVVLKSSWFHQKYNGSGYGQGYVEHGDILDILCENVK